MKTKEMKNETSDPCVELPVGRLRQILVGLGKCISRNPSIPMLGCIHLSHDGKGTVEFTSTDLNTWITARLPKTASGAPAFDCLIPVNALRDALKGVSASSIVRLRKEKAEMMLEIGGKRKVLPRLKEAEFPRPPVFSGKAQALTEKMKTAITEALSCASHEETRYILQGVAFDLSKPKCHHIVGTDGRHLYSANSFTLPVPDSLILPGNPLFQWKPFREGAAWNLRVNIDRKTRAGACEITSGCWRTVGQLVDGQYPNWRQVVPADSTFAHQVELSAGDARKLGDRIAELKIAKSGSNFPVVLLGDGKTLQIGWRDADSEKERSFVMKGARVTGKRFGIALDQKYLVKALGFGLTRIGITDEMSPARFSDGNGRQMIIMPLRHSIPENTPAKTRPPAGATASRPRSKPPAPATAPPQSAPKPAPKAEPAPSLEEAMQELIKVKETLQVASQGLRKTAGLIRQAKQEQRSTDREVRTVRSTLRSLRKVRL